MITDVQRIVVKRNNTEIKTNTLILTFNTPKIPDSLKISYLNIPVSQYVPNPIRCYKQGVPLAVAHSPGAIGNVGGLLENISMVAHRASGNKIDNIMMVRELYHFL